MNKTKTVTVALMFLLVLIPMFQVKASNSDYSVAYIYSTDLTSAESYESFLTAQGMTVDLVPNSTATTWDYSSYGLIIVGSDTGWGYQWWPEAAVSVIDGAGKPILGLGYGGSCFFTKLGLYVDWGHGWIGTKDSIYVVDVYHQIFHFPTELTIPSDRIISLYDYTGHIGIYMPSAVSGVTPLGRESDDLNHYPLIQEAARYVLWGFTNSPEDMTQTGKDLFVNTVTWLGLHNPVAAFTFSPTGPQIDETVSFDASGSDDPDGTIVSYAWDFGDGAPPGTGVTPTHAYTSAGTYTATLTVTDNDGLTDTATADITVVSIDVTNPVADAGNDQEVEVEATVTFNAGESSDNMGVASYKWDFGDGNTETGVIATHAYTKKGTYTVTLTVEDAAGNSDTDTVVIRVQQAAAAFPLWALAPIIGGIIGVTAVLFYLKRRKPKEKVPKPAKVKITVEPAEILADGKSTSTITIELLDKKGKTVSALTDTEIKLTSTRGKIEKPMAKIPKGGETEKTVLVSSKEAGTATLSADVKGLESTSITVTFKEKKRYCMHCGAKMPFTARRCPECGKAPPAGVDTKLCKNCDAVIPIVSKFCSECGASQPKQAE